MSHSKPPLSAIRRNSFPKIKKIPGIAHVQVFATKAGIIRTDEDIQGVVLKGIGSDFDWSYFKSNMVEGSAFAVYRYRASQ
jgi:lipoprotein-releasing system permease protein